MRRIVTLVFVAALCAELSACGSSSPPSPKAVRASIVAAALAQKSVHWTEIDRPHMVWPSKFTSDVNADSGMKRVTFYLGEPGYEGNVHLLLVNHTVYVRGDALGLEDELYLTKAQATKYAGQWISIPKGDTLFAPTADGLTLASIVHDVTPEGQLLVTRRKSSAARLLFVQGKRFPYSTLSAHVSGEPLPVGFETSNGVGSSTSGSFSKWNEPVRLQAPADSTPIAIVRGSPKAVLAAIVGAALAQKSLHLTASVSEDIFGTTSYSIDVNRDSASERVEYDGSTMHLLLFRHAVYLRGDALLLEERLGLTQGQARRYAGKWIWVPRTRGDKLYADLTDGLTLASVVRRAARMVDLKLTTGTSRGTSFLVMRGTPANPLLPVNELKARAIGTPLPVAFSGWLPGVSASGRFSKWNEPVEIRLPESSTPIAIIRGS